MPWTEPPFAVFVLAELDAKKINDILQDAWSAGGVSWLWLATDDYNDAPSKERDDNEANVGTELPIDEKWTSPFTDKSVEDIATWLRAKPNNVDLDNNHFAVLDKQSTNGSVLVCRLGGRHLKGDSLDTYRFENGQLACSFLVGHEPGDWEDTKGHQ